MQRQLASDRSPQTSGPLIAVRNFFLCQQPIVHNTAWADPIPLSHHHSPIPHGSVGDRGTGNSDRHA